VFAVLTSMNGWYGLLFQFVRLHSMESNIVKMLVIVHL